MTTSVFSVVILAALLHALWNSLIKGADDKYVGTTAVALGYIPIALMAIFIVPSPARESWPYIASSIVLHTSYMAFLLQAYRIGDLTQVYPIARGSAPLLVAVVSVVFLGVSLSQIELLSLLLMSVGIMSLSLVRRADGLRNLPAASYALVTGCFIAAYSINDGLGGRLSGTPVGYFAWIALGVGLVWLAAATVIKPNILINVAKHGKLTLVVGGTSSFVAYVLVIWAFTQAPIALVSALRETSIIFALIIGVGFLKERLDLAKVFSTFMTITGAALLRFAK